MQFNFKPCYNLLNNYQKRFYSKTNFATEIFEAIENFAQKKMAKEVGKNKYKSRYNGKSKKRQWENYDETNEAIELKRANFNPQDRIKKKKMIILLGYSGANYYGMQRNPGQKTIEEDLFTAMLKCKWIDQDGFNQAQHVQFQRAARTDKGVSAARQVCSVKLPENLNLDVINSELPPQIRVFATRRVTKGFNSKDQCDARTYSYTLPTIAFSHHSDIVDLETYRTNKDNLERLNNILKLYEGTKNFHNFTSRKEFLDPSAKRFIMSFNCAEPFINSDGVEFATIHIKGQSFMMHQIRKMIGLCLAVLRGHTEIETINRAFTEERLDLPMAPGLGLVLNDVHYNRYNERYGSDGIHEQLIWDKEEALIKEFIEKYINSTIFETELKEKSLETWLPTLAYHSYDVRKENVENVTETVEHDENVKDLDNVLEGNSSSNDLKPLEVVASNDFGKQI